MYIHNSFLRICRKAGKCLHKLYTDEFVASLGHLWHNARKNKIYSCILTFIVNDIFEQVMKDFAAFDCQTGLHEYN